MKKSPSTQKQEQGENRKDQIRIKLPGISFEIITTANRIIKLTVILCVFILVFTLLIKGIRLA